MNTQNNAEETHNSNSTKLIDREQMENTPFYIIGTQETGYFATMGKFQITEVFPTKEAVKNHIETQVWQIIMKVMSIVMTTILEEHDLIKKDIIKKDKPISKI